MRRGQKPIEGQTVPAELYIVLSPLGTLVINRQIGRVRPVTSNSWSKAITIFERMPLLGYTQQIRHKERFCQVVNVL